MYKDESYNSDTVDDVDARGKELIQDSSKSKKRTQKMQSKQKLVDNSDQNDAEDSQQDLEDSNIVHICGYTIDIEKITKQEILKMRKILPKKDYR